MAYVSLEQVLSQLEGGGGVLAAEPLADATDVVASHAYSVADEAMLLAMLYDPPVGKKRGGRPRGERAKCGTNRGYGQHLYYGERTCDACRAAHTERSRKRGRSPDLNDKPRAKCGTNKAYHQHQRRREQTCDACKAAHAAYESKAAKRRRRSKKNLTA